MAAWRCADRVGELMTNVKHDKIRSLFPTSYINIVCCALRPDKSIS